MINFFIRFFCWLHNFSYKVIGFLAIKKNKGLHPKHEILNYHQFFLDNFSSGDAVLDIGCGNGALAYDLSKKAASVVAIDINAKNIETAKRKYPNDNLQYVIGDATVYAFKQNFDVIVLSNVLEHIENRVDFLKKIKRMAPKILIRVPLLTRDWLAVYKKNLGTEYRLDTTHFIEYTEESFEEEIEKSGFKTENSFTKFGELYGVIKKIG